jgi:hypothetical protein
MSLKKTTVLVAAFAKLYNFCRDEREGISVQTAGNTLRCKMDSCSTSNKYCKYSFWGVSVQFVGGSHHWDNINALVVRELGNPKKK